MNWDNKVAGCDLCEQVGGELIWQNEQLRVVLVNEPLFAGFTRVIWQEHVAEMTDLAPEQRSQLMRTVCLVEQIQRDVLKPTKVNLASLGNMTPHLHWHVIPRWHDDRHFPEPVWGNVQRENPARQRAVVADDTLRQALRRQLHPEENQG